MWELDSKESWAQKNWCFWTVVLEKTLESPLDCKEIQLVHPKRDHPGCSLEGLMLRLKLQYFSHLMWRTDSLENTLMLGKIEGRRRRGWERMRWLDGIADPMDMSLSKLWEVVIGKPGCCNPWGRRESDMTERLNWNEHSLHQGSLCVVHVYGLSMFIWQIQNVMYPLPQYHTEWFHDTKVICALTSHLSLFSNPRQLLILILSP